MISRSAARNAANESPIGAIASAVKSTPSSHVDGQLTARLVHRLKSITKSTGQIFQAITGASVDHQRRPQHGHPVAALAGDGDSTCNAATTTHIARWNNASRGAIRNSR